MDWQPIETAPKDGSIVWAAAESSMCPAYFYVGAWRNWYKGPRYENVKLGAEAYAPEEIWFEPTHWMPTPRPPGELQCCDGGPQWGHDWNCRSVPD